jgi:hypothetical protein
MRARLFRIAFAGAMALVVLPGAALAQTSESSPQLAERIKSMGQPPRFKPYLAGEFAWNRGEIENTGAYAVAGVYRDLVVPTVGGLGLSLEGYGGPPGDSRTGGALLHHHQAVLSRLRLGLELPHRRA